METSTPDNDFKRVQIHSKLLALEEEVLNQDSLPTLDQWKRLTTLHQEIQQVEQKESTTHQDNTAKIELDSLRAKMGDLHIKCRDLSRHNHILTMENTVLRDRLKHVIESVEHFGGEAERFTESYGLLVDRLIHPPWHASFQASKNPHRDCHYGCQVKDPTPGWDCQRGRLNNQKLNPQQTTPTPVNSDDECPLIFWKKK